MTPRLVSRWLFGGLAALLLASAPLLFAAYLESDYPDDKGNAGVRPPPPRELPPPERPIIRPPPPPPVGGDEVAELLRRLEIGRAFQHRGLTLYPIILARDLDGRRYLTLDDGLRRGDLTIEETGRVNELLVSNRGDARAFLLGGEQERRAGEQERRQPTEQPARNEARGHQAPPGAARSEGKGSHRNLPSLADTV